MLEKAKKLEKFEDFTNLYELSKTLRFELKPIGNTQKMLEDEKVFEKDKVINDKYLKTKPYFDRLHREFVDEALSAISLSRLDEYLKLLKDWKVDKKSKEKQKALEKKQEKLRQEIVSFFDAKAKNWAENKYNDLGLKNKDIEILFEEGIFKLLQEKYGKEKDAEILDEASGEMVSIFDSWKGFVGYFDKFHATRKNFYKADGTTTALATRIIDQNLKRFCDNLEVYETVKDKINFSESEKELSVKLHDVFSLSYYNGCVLQAGIDRYNEILGGKVEKNGEKKKGLNEYINKYRQDNKGEKLQFFKLLDKQIIGEREKEDFIVEIKDDKELLKVLQDFYQISEEKINILKSLFGRFISQNSDFSLNEIYLSKEAFNTIAHKWTGETEIFEKALSEEPAGLKYEKEDDSYKFPNFIALSHVKNSLTRLTSEKFWKEKYYKTEENPKGFLAVGLPSFEQFLKIFEFELGSLFKSSFVNQKTGEETEVGYDVFKNAFKKLIDNKEFSKNKEGTIVIKDFADSVLTIYQMAKYFAVEKKRAWDDSYELDNVFYKDPENGYSKFYENAYALIVQKYNLLRNYLTKKPYSEEKYKLNFDHSKLLGGFTESKTENSNNGTQYGAYLLRKKSGNGFSYFLGISKNAHLVSFFEDIDESGESGYERLNYYQVKTNSIYGTSYDGDYQEDKRNLSEKEVVSKIKKSLSGYVSRIKDVDSIIKTEYESIKGIQKDIDRLVTEKGRSFIYRAVSKKQLDYAFKCTQGFYLFEIYSKDFSNTKKSSSMDNLHTMYFKKLVSENQSFFDLGGGEIFFRPKTTVDKLGYRKDKNNQIMLYKDENGKNAKVVQNRRYAKDKIIFHLSVFLNSGTEEVPKQENAKKYFCHQFNQKVNNFIANSEDVKIIGVDRGEKHLAYYSVVDQSGKKIDSGSLNIINEVDYAEKLENKAIGREQARRDWQDVEGIKNLKKGYVSQVVRKLADLAIEHNAIIVFEDLNMRFKQIRGGIEKSAYQQLEKGLIEKFSFLVNKEEKNKEKAGNLLKAYQLAAPFTAFKDMGKQTGIIFYTEARYTSKIDPVTGWRPSLYLKYTNAASAKKDILKFKKIEFKKEKKRFEFTYDIKRFNDKKEYPNKIEWTLCSCVERFYWRKSLNQNRGGYEPPFKDLTENFEKLFSQNNIDYKDGDILAQIEKIDEKGNEKFFKDFIFLFKLICQIRNTDEKAIDADKKDFILSPVEPFFDSRKAAAGLPSNGDENGAYNIARKGIVVINKIKYYYKKNGSCEKMSWGDLYVSDKDWDDFVQKN